MYICIYIYIIWKVVLLWSSSKKYFSIDSSVWSLLSANVSVSNDVNIGNNRSFVMLSLSVEYLMFLLVSSSIFLLCNLKKSLRILLGFLKSDSRFLCCYKFLLFFYFHCQSLVCIQTSTFLWTIIPFFFSFYINIYNTNHKNNIIIYLI